MAARAKAYDAVIAAPFGALGIAADRALTSIDFLPAGARPQAASTALAREVCAQLRAYLRDGAHRFDLPLDLAGTDYQRRVWRALTRIPPGRPLSYGALAARLASGPRAVGGACRANPVPIVVPCHRVVACSGLGGFMGGERAGPLSIKEWLLAHERG
ncbi:MAG TPA: methylated-DNA--[protein]-cysteine S-methyltransferase [Acidiferrobacterales bacterium]